MQEGFAISLNKEVYSSTKKEKLFTLSRYVWIRHLNRSPFTKASRVFSSPLFSTVSGRSNRNMKLKRRDVCCYGNKIAHCLTGVTDYICVTKSHAFL